MSKSSSTLTAAGFELIKQYGGEEQVKLKVIVKVPGSWFGGGAEGGLSAGERREFYEAQAAEYDPCHALKKGPGAKKRGSNEPALRFVCISDAAEDATHPGYWMPLAQWNRYRHDTYKNDRQTELQFILAPSDQAAALPTATEPEEKPTGIAACFEVVKTGPHEQRVKGGSTKTVQCTWYKCLQPRCTRKEPIREVGKGTGQLFRELKKCNPALWRKLRLESKHSRLIIGENGEEVELMTFKESLPHHVRFVKWCVRDWQPFARSRSPALLVYIRGLNARAGLPHRETCIKILGVLRTLTDGKVMNVISALRRKFGEPFAASTSDVWSTLNCTTSFFCQRLNLVLEPDMVFTAGSTGTRPTTLVEAAPVISFREFTETKHSGSVLAAVKTEGLAKYNMTACGSLVLMTEDGASNNKAAAKILGAPFKVCCPHNLQRAVLFAAGMAGSVSANPDLKALSASRMAAAPHRSIKTSTRLQDAQIQAGTHKRRVLTTQTQNETRWTGLYRMANANRRLEKCLAIALTGSETGITAEEPSEPADEDEDDSDDDDLAMPPRVDVEADEALIAGNEAAGKDYPLSHRLLDQRSFLNNALLESVLSDPHEVCLLLQKDQGVSLSMAWQLVRVLRASASTAKLQVVGGTTKDGEWREMDGAHLPDMFQKFRSILAQQLDDRFHCSTTPDKPTLLSLAFDPSVDTSAETGIFSGRSAAQDLMDGEHRRALLRRHQRMRATAAPAPAPAPDDGGTSPAPRRRAVPSCVPAPAPAPTPGKAKAAGKRPLSVLTMMQPAKVAAVAAGTVTDPSKEIDDEMAKFKAIKAGVVAEGAANRFYEKQIFNHKCFWYEHRTELPLHYNAYVPEVGPPKAASANVETVFSGVGGMKAKAASLGPQLTADYNICHHNWQYAFFEPSDEDVVAAYEKLYGSQARDSDAESSEEEEGSGEEEEGEEEGSV